MPATPRVFETAAKSVLTKSRISGLDYAVNPYVGCTHACAYCYATFMRRFMKIQDEWGDFVGVKVNAADVLAREARRKVPGVVSLGTVCDPYQAIERERRITRDCLQVFTEVDGYDVGVLTKSDLVLRDADVIARIPDAEVGFTVTTLEPEVAGVLEPGAPPPARRLAAMRELCDRGIGVWGFFGPVLPGLSDSEEAIAEVLEAMSGAGASHVLVDRMNLYPKVLARLRLVLGERLPEALPVVEAAKRDPEAYGAVLARRIREGATALGVGVRLCF